MCTGEGEGVDDVALGRVTIIPSIFNSNACSNRDLLFDLVG